MTLNKSLAVWVLLAVTLSMAAPQSAKVRSVLGDVSFKNKGQGDWASLRVGAKVQEKDLIQTDLESGVLISMPEGSTISIEENALVEFTQVMFIKDSQISEINIKKGLLRFNAQKQTGKDRDHDRIDSRYGRYGGHDGRRTVVRCLELGRDGDGREWPAGLGEGEAVCCLP